jgi:hypothetical protein
LRYPARARLEGILYVLHTDTPWLEVPYRELGLPSGETWLEQALIARGIEPRISKPRPAGAPIPAGTPTREVWRGKKRRLKTPDPQTRHRWPIERTNAWLEAKRRIATRRDRKPRQPPRPPPPRHNLHLHQAALRSTS